MAEHRTMTDGCCPGNRGFSMIEMVITLLIISLLVTIAVPRFINSRSRTYMAEMKTNLAALGNAEKAYWAATNTYTDDLTLLGWRLDGSPRYLYGFTSDALPAASGTNDSAELAAAGVAKYNTTKMLDGSGLPLTDGDLPTSPASRDAFTAGAVGNVDDDVSLDRWTLDSNGKFTHVSDDLDD